MTTARNLFLLLSFVYVNSVDITENVTVIPDKLVVLKHKAIRYGYL